MTSSMTMAEGGGQRGQSVADGPFRSLLIAVDFSSATERLVARSAAPLPLARGARLSVLHVVPSLLPRQARRLAGSDAKKALAATSRSLSAKLPAGRKVSPVVRVGFAATEIAHHARSCRADLVVMGRGGGRTVRDIFLGSTAERVIRAGQLPVLVVRLPGGKPYRRPMLALDTDQATDNLLALTLRVVQPPRPRIGVVHAYDIPYHGLIYPSVSPERGNEYRQEYREKALQDIARLLATGLATLPASARDGLSWRTHVRFGSPRRTIPDTIAETRADLLVLGTHGHTGVAHALLGTVAGDVLRDVPCDVLVVPPGRRRRQSR